MHCSIYGPFVDNYAGSISRTLQFKFSAQTISNYAKASTLDAYVFSMHKSYYYTVNNNVPRVRLFWMLSLQKRKTKRTRSER